MKSKKLTIIIPYYNDEPYTSQLLEKLAPQVTDDVEVIVVDDGSRIPFETDFNWVKVYHKENGGVSTARNLGIDKAKGDYITFMDADDSIPDYYVQKVLEKAAETGADIIEYSWRSYNDGGYHIKLQSDDEYQVNPAVWCRAIKRSFLSDIRFNEKKDSTEDEDFSRKVGYMEAGNYSHVVIPEYMYYYRDSLTNSKHKRFRKGIMRTKKVVYYYEHITKAMSWLIDEVKKEDENNEVWILTKQNDLPELKRYARIRLPMTTWAHIVRGEHFDGITKIKPPIRCQIAISSDVVNMVGGITTFIYNFCKAMREYYDIVFVYDKCEPQKLARMREIVRCIKQSSNAVVSCDTLIVNRLDDNIPKNVVYKRSIQMIHCCKLNEYKIPTDRTEKVIVSQAAKDSWGEPAADARVIHNIGEIGKKKSLFLVSATRTHAFDKGENDKRMIQLANMLNAKGIPFVWLVFGSKQIKNTPKNMIYMNPIPNVSDIIAKADYMVQLSDEESFSYTILEALTQGTACLTTGFEALKELGFVDEKMGYILPHDMDFDVERILNVPKFDYKYDNDKVIEEWRELLGDSKPTPNYYSGQVKVRCIIDKYTDMKLGRDVLKGEEYLVSIPRADSLVYDYGFVEVID